MKSLAATEGGVLEDLSNTFFYYAGYETYESSAEVTEAMIAEAKVLAGKRLEEWLAKHVGTYVALSAPLLGAVNPLRAVLSGESMGLPVPEREARDLER